MREERLLSVNFVDVCIEYFAFGLMLCCVIEDYS